MSSNGCSAVPLSRGCVRQSLARAFHGCTRRPAFRRRGRARSQACEAASRHHHAWPSHMPPAVSASRALKAPRVPLLIKVERQHVGTGTGSTPGCRRRWGRQGFHMPRRRRLALLCYCGCFQGCLAAVVPAAGTTVHLPREQLTKHSRDLGKHWKLSLRLLPPRPWRSPGPGCQVAPWPSWPTRLLPAAAW